MNLVDQIYLPAKPQSADETPHKKVKPKTKPDFTTLQGEIS
tara:strand:- start:1507 stop:1629 length:123 start_codon:yes stop_codon:yes gene_type:complete